MILYKRQTSLNIYTPTAKHVIDDLDFSFNVSAHRRNTPNEGDFLIFNVGKDLRDIFKGEAEYIEFYAGYETSGKSLIHKGYIDQVEIKSEGPEIVTGIHSKDAGRNKEYTSAIVSQTFGKGTTLKAVFLAIGTLLNMPVTLDYLGNEQLLLAETFCGPAKDALDSLCKDYGYRWAIQFGTLEILVKDQPPSRDNVAILLDADNIIEEVEKTKHGVSLRTLILPGLIPSRLVTIPAGVQDAGGTYIVDSVRYTGEQNGQDYNADIDLWSTL